LKPLPKVVVPKHDEVKLIKKEEPKPKHQHISVPLVEDKYTDEKILNNGRKIVEQAEGQNDDKKVQTMGDKQAKR